MAASSRGSSAAAALLRRGQSSICASCRSTQFRSYSSSAETAATAEADQPKYPPSPQYPPAEYRIKSGIILTRAPLLTRTLTPFENAFFFYQKRLNERLVLPFRHTLFFKKDTATDLDWRIKFNERGRIPAKELGRYYPQGRNAWNDELLVGSTLSSEERLRDILLKDAENRVTEDGEEAKGDEIIPVERPMDRITEADKTNDVRRLDRKLDRTLYLVVKASDGIWQFPSVDVPTDGNLHESAARALESAAGVNMNTWMVGRVPVARMIRKPEYNEDNSFKQRGEKVFFLKGRIMAGQADLKGNKLGLLDFNWLTREELKEILPEKYFYSVRNMMADR
ncbi:39S mitochondrial ribosomal protein L46-domain-containing protein [Annulohypoxylon maeteangense]|uniref:39S mitochondrial ribosomal protein L46-domain-containing protein n=1 Tax=Annulohypoxylon maeteangense TaxID=1927788 RepID=UPI002008CE98|nr:39S mitochondrial ribosomal protein L46-domain-containing protein [Annulohypoxylon maeteangense]KAI0881877.1 39S mitochondrial ribosomal protein L46-domain-containing protein [Annulohypoxylon maeteangense]